jgi:hypothetical protein
LSCINNASGSSLAVSAGPSSPGVEEKPLEKECEHNNLPQEDLDTVSSEKPMATPAQCKLAVQLEEEKDRLLKLQDLRDCGLATSDNVRQLTKCKQTIHQKQLKLKRLKKDAERQKSRRKKLKVMMSDLASGGSRGGQSGHAPPPPI